MRDCIAANGKQPGDPLKAAQLLVELVHGEGAVKDKELPTTIGFGTDYYEGVKEITEGTLKRMVEWEQVTRSTDFPKDS